MSKYMKYGLREQYEVQNIECLTMRDVLSALDSGAELLDSDVNDNFQVTKEEDLEVALENPMGLTFISRLESGVDGHNPVFSKVAERLGLNPDFTPKPVEPSGE